MVWNNRGRMLCFLQRYEAALESYEKALALDSENYYNWYSKAWVLDQLQRPQEAEEAHRQAEKLKPKGL
ncbi:MAG: tetratricopeptide repeat protein [Hydrococcus sp. RM1_1_31]|nr:tetratricopeptide repeat protein [Hydrococcus sp. RM1_1_31]